MQPSKTKERLLVLSELREQISYNERTGVFSRLVTRGRMVPGERCGWVERDGYRRIELRGKSFLAHRLAWFYVTGTWPTGDIDHINGRRDDNRLVNLREATTSLNMQNQRQAQNGNKVGALGVTAKGSGFRARITVDGKTIIIGKFATVEEAAKAYLDAKRKLHKGCTI